MHDMPLVPGLIIVFRFSKTGMIPFDVPITIDMDTAMHIVRPKFRLPIPENA